MQLEKNQLKKYNVYEEIDELPHGKQPVDTKWVLREKRDEIGNLIKRKARLTGRGFTQVPGTHYDSNGGTYAPVARPESWRTILYPALSEGWRIEQADIVAAYLNAYLKHEVYVKDPAVTGSKVWKLHKALYGLKQSAHESNTEMTGILAQAGLHPLKTDPACYIGSGIRIASHVDDYLITTSSDQIFELCMTNLEKALDVDKRGTPRKFLGIECTPKTEFKEWNRGRNNRQTISSMHLTQTKMIEALCEQYSVSYRASTPCRSDADLSITRPTEDETVNPAAYQSIIGSLSYIS
jgi:hypothetical protein